MTLIRASIEVANFLGHINLNIVRLSSREHQVNRNRKTILGLVRNLVREFCSAGRSTSLKFNKKLTAILVNQNLMKQKRMWR